MNIPLLILCGPSGAGLIGEIRKLAVYRVLYIDTLQNIDKHRPNLLRSKRIRFLPLDSVVRSTWSLLSGFVEHQQDSARSLQEQTNPYLNTSSIPEPDSRRLRFLWERTDLDAPLSKDIVCSPAIGGLAIRHPTNAALLQNLLSELAPLHIGPDNPVEAWIVSATTEGAGEGIHRFVAAFLSRLIFSRFRGTPLYINFIRIGPGAFASRYPWASALNTFLGVVADTAFTRYMKDAYPLVAFRWFYVDFPSIDEPERYKRAVATITKALMNPYLQKDLDRVVTYNLGVPMALARVGTWEKDWDEDVEYVVGLQQLPDKLRELRQPNYRTKYIYEREAPRFRAVESPRDRLWEWKELVRDVDLILERRWRLPQTPLEHYPENIEDVRGLVNKWREAVEALVGEEWDQPLGEWVVQWPRTDEQGRKRPKWAPLRVERGDTGKFGEARWFRRLEETHWARAWAWYLLGCDLEEGKPQPGGRENPTRIDRLLALADEIGRIQSEWSPFKSVVSRTKKIAERLPEFLEMLAEVDALLRVEMDATLTLKELLEEVEGIEAFVNEEVRALGERLGQENGEMGSILHFYDLHEIADSDTGRTWLQALREGARSKNPDHFRQAVLLGLKGVTSKGLMRLLGVSSLKRAVAEMNRHLGGTKEARDLQPTWWAGMKLSPSYQQQWRILPRMPAQDWKTLQQAKATQTSDHITYIQSNCSDLMVVGLEVASMHTTMGETIRTPRLLTEPFAKRVRQMLAQQGGRYRLMVAGVIGEPLYLPVLKAVGLTEKEIQHLQTIYSLWE